MPPSGRIAGVQASVDLALKISRNTFGTGFVLTGALGNLLLIVATANPLGLSATGGVYWPGTVVVLILSLLGIGLLEGGVAVIRRPFDEFRSRHTPVGHWFNAFLGVVTLVAILGFLGLGLRWASGEIQTGLQATAETYVVVGTLALYLALRVVLTLSHTSGGELARAVGISTEPVQPDPGETFGRFALRLVIGFLIGIPLLDSLIVLVGVALAPNDRRIYPTPSDNTMVAALLWLIGIAAVSSGIGAALRGRADVRMLRVRAIVAVATLVPAIVLDARVPLYPFIAGIFGQASR